MYFHTESDNVVAALAGLLSAAADNGKRIRIDVDHGGSPRIKVGEGMWSAPLVSTPDPYRDNG